MTITAEILDPATNCAIVKLSVRRFPGVLLQGDTLNSLYVETRRALAALDPVADEAACDALQTVVERLRGCLDFYEATLLRHGYSLPY